MQQRYARDREKTMTLANVEKLPKGTDKANSQNFKTKPHENIQSICLFLC